MNQSISNRGVCRTAPGIPGPKLSIRMLFCEFKTKLFTYVLNISKDIQSDKWSYLWPKMQSKLFWTEWTECVLDKSNTTGPCLLSSTTV